MEAETTKKEPGMVLSVCSSCKENLQGKSPKLMPCLHTLCGSCALQGQADAASGHTVKCPTCQQESNISDVITNEFVSGVDLNAPSDSGAQPGEGAVRTCTGCDENIPGTSYCVDCSEYLCDQCVQAHRRVKITKEHTIQPIDEVNHKTGDGSARSLEKPIHCPIHRNEALKLYCETCDKLTCRDCQLLEHKEHRYSFVSEASATYKSFLQTLLQKIKEKQTYIDNAKSLITKRNTEIAEREKQVASEVKNMAVKVINEINQRGKKLLTDLNAVCGAKKSQLSQKQKEIETLSAKLDHATKFADFILNTENLTAMMHSKKLLVDQLKSVLRTRCEVPNPYHVVDIRVKYEETYILNALSQLGRLIVDNVAYAGVPSGPSSGSVSPVSVLQRQLQIPNLSPKQREALHQIHSKIPNMANLTHEQKQLLLNKIANMRATASPVSSPTVNHGPPRFPNVNAAQPYTVQYPSSTAGQSNMVTSSHTPSSRPNSIGNGYSNIPTSVVGGGVKSLINLDELQRRRNVHSQHQHRQMMQQRQQYSSTDMGGNNYSNAIVIEPAAEEPTPMPSSTVHHTPGGSRSRYSPVIDLTRHNPPPSNNNNTGNHGNNSLTPSPGAPQLYSRQSSTDSGNSNKPSQSGYDEVVIGTGIVKKEESFPTLSLDASDFNFDADPTSFLSDKMKSKQDTSSSQSANSTVSSPVGGEQPVPSTSSTPDITTPRITTPDITTPDITTPDITTPDITTPTTEDKTSVKTIEPKAGNDEENTKKEEPMDTVEKFETSKEVESTPENLKSPPLDVTSDRSPDNEASQGFPFNDLELGMSHQELNNILSDSVNDTAVPSPGKGKGPASMARVTTDHNPNDPSEDYCACCHNGGDLLCCDTCPKVYHLNCHVPVLTTQPSGDTWVCGLCTDPVDITLTAPDSRGEESYPLGSKRKVAVGLTNKELKVCERILLELFAHESSVPFHEPVSKTLVPDYYNVITNAMDFMKIRQKLSRTHFNHYDIVDEFLSDVRLVFENCAKYNARDSEVGKMGLQVESYFDDLVEKYLPYVDHRAHSPNSTKSEGSKPRPKKMKRKSEESLFHVH